MLYKNKKVKSWKEGFLKFNPQVNQRVALLDENHVKIDSVYVSLTMKELELDAQMDLEQHLCLVEERVSCLEKTTVAPRVQEIVQRIPPRPRNMKPLKLKSITRIDSIEPEERFSSTQALCDRLNQESRRKHNVSDPISPQEKLLPAKRVAPTGHVSRKKTCLAAWESDQGSDDDRDESAADDAQENVVASPMHTDTLPEASVSRSVDVQPLKLPPSSKKESMQPPPKKPLVTINPKKHDTTHLHFPRAQGIL